MIEMDNYQIDNNSASVSDRVDESGRVTLRKKPTGPEFMVVSVTVVDSAVVELNGVEYR